MSSPEEAYIKTSGLTLKTPLGRVYENVDFSASKGEVVAVFGNEGCGKTALLLTLAGRMKASSGAASVAGFDLKKKYNKVRALSNITIVHRLNDVTENVRVREILAAELMTVGKSGRRANVDAYLKNWALSDVADTKFSDLESYDEKMFDIALACAGDPDLLMVDEIQHGLTQHQSLKIVGFLRELAREKNMTILVATVEYDIARRCDKVLVFTPEAELQRQACIKDNGPDADCVVCGTGNGAVAAPSLKPVKEGGRA